jgi:hypothetical protein
MGLMLRSLLRGPLLDNLELTDNVQPFAPLS